MPDEPTGAQPEIVVYETAEEVAAAIAARLSARITDLQQAGPNRTVTLALTGGRIATAAYRQLAAEGPESAADWSRVDLWWGDERFVPAESSDRNDREALDALLPALPLPDDHIHPMSADDGSQGLDEAAAEYADQLGDTRFDICLLGVGPDGHVASIFPDHPSSRAEGDVIGVRDSPKPPLQRISLTHRVINRSAEVWFTVSGQDKAAAVGKALLGAAGEPRLPAADAHGTRRTLWLLDRPAASNLPADMTRHD